MSADIEALKERHPIEDVLARLGVEAPRHRSARGDFMISCPSALHDDPNPSCIVHSQDDRFYCFGCGERGDIFDLVELVAGTRQFSDAVAWLEASGRPTLRVQPTRTPTRVTDDGSPNLSRTSLDRVLEVNAVAWEVLTEPPQIATAHRYLESRGIAVRELEEREGRSLVGYSCALRDGLAQRLRAAGFDDEEMIDAGWATLREGALRDRLRRRVVFPIRDSDGHVLGYTARDVTSAERAKYMNTPTTVAYRKTECLYRPVSQDNGRVVLCEGPIDALAIAQARDLLPWQGPSVALATLGTQLTQQQAQIAIRQSVGGPIVVGDGDKAGEMAAIAWVALLAEVGAHATMYPLPLGLDPATRWRRVQAEHPFALLEKL